MGYETMAEERGKKSSRLLAFLGVVFSTVSVVSCLIAFPLMFNYVQNLQSSVQNDLDFCRSRSRDMWKEVIQMHNGQSGSERLSKAIETLGHFDDRFKRQAATSTASPDAGAAAAPIAAAPAGRAGAAPGTCCTCHRGLPGPAGAPGVDGRPGMDMEPGEPGTNGAPAQLNYDPATLLPKDCPCTASPGDAGAAGPKGANGNAGAKGADGENGKDGDNGPRGAAGPQGGAGKGGAPGPKGDDGPLLPQPLPAGPPGPKGPDGGPGANGAPGAPGNAGPNGAPGPQGEAGGPGKDGGLGGNGKPGANGAPGPKGSCTHCPPARLAPGY